MSPPINQIMEYDSMNEESKRTMVSSKQVKIKSYESEVQNRPMDEEEDA